VVVCKSWNFGNMQFWRVQIAPLLEHKSDAAVGYIDHICSVQVSASAKGAILHNLVQFAYFA
jgi:hypothetical protein